MNKIEHEGIGGTCARIEINRDADKADQKVKLFLKAHKTYQTFLGSIFSILFFPSFYSGSHFTNFSPDFHPFENES